MTYLGSLKSYRDAETYRSTLQRAKELNKHVTFFSLNKYLSMMDNPNEKMYMHMTHDCFSTVQGDNMEEGRKEAQEAAVQSTLAAAQAAWTGARASKKQSKTLSAAAADTASKYAEALIALQFTTLLRRFSTENDLYDKSSNSKRQQFSAVRQHTHT